MELKFKAIVNGKVKEIEHPATLTFKDGKVIYWDELNHSANINAIPIQYMGLKDANGNEIYEGDILKAKRTVTGILGKDGKVYEVFGGDDTQKITGEWDELILAEFKKTETGVSFTLPQDMTYQERGKTLKWEVFGNIHITPNLMTDRHDG